LSGSLAYAEIGNMTSELCTLMADLKETVSRMILLFCNDLNAEEDL
jgi:hypothetical protein